jgi:hypothetical protein
MKLFSAFNKWRVGYPLSNSEKHAVEEFVNNLKVGSITVLAAIILLLLLNLSGCFGGSQISSDELHRLENSN